jgi:hypothetical protein
VKVSLVLDSNEWGRIFGLISPAVVKEAPDLYRSLLDQFSRHVHDEHVTTRHDEPVHQHVLDALTEIIYKTGDRLELGGGAPRNFLLLESIHGMALKAKESLEKATCGDTSRLRAACEKALPWLIRLGDLIGNGDGKDPMGRCDAVLAIREALEK